MLFANFPLIPTALVLGICSTTVPYAAITIFVLVSGFYVFAIWKAVTWFGGTLILCSRQGANFFQNFTFSVAIGYYLVAMLESIYHLWGFDKAVNDSAGFYSGESDKPDTSQLVTYALCLAPSIVGYVWAAWCIHVAELATGSNPSAPRVRES
jgi:uncharacterized membrane protein